jgi:hypothetical protein
MGMAVKGYRLQVTGYRLQVTGYRLQVAGCRGAVRTSVTLVGQYIGNTVGVSGYSLVVLFLVFFGPISARKKLAVVGSIQPSSNRANQTSICCSGDNFRPTDHPAKLELIKNS